MHANGLAHLAPGGLLIIIEQERIIAKSGPILHAARRSGGARVSCQKSIQEQDNQYFYPLNSDSTL